MSLKFALLGYISTCPISGYDISREFGGAFGSFWYAKHSQIYPALRKLESEKLIKKKTVIKGNVLKKNLYGITRKGLDELKAWGRELPSEPSSQKDSECLKLMYMDLCSVEDIERYFDFHRSQFQEQVGFWQDRYEEISSNSLDRLKNRIKNLPYIDADLIKMLKEMSVDQQLRRRQADLEWVENCQKKMERWKKSKKRRSVRKDSK